MNTTEVIPFKEPRALVGLAVKPPALFLPDEKAAYRSSVSSPPISAI